MYNTDTRAEAQGRVHHKEQLAQLQHLEATFIATMRQLVQYLDGKTTKTEVINQLQAVKTPDVAQVVAAITKLDAGIKAKTIDLSPLKAGIEALQKDFQAVAGKLPGEHPKDISVNNLSELSNRFDGIVKAIEGLKIDVNVPQTAVHVDKPDLLPLQQSLLTVVSAIKAIKLPDAPKIDLKKLETGIADVTSGVKQLHKDNKEALLKLQRIADKPVGGGGGGGSPVITVNGQQSVPVVNPDGTFISSGTTGGGTVIYNNSTPLGTSGTVSSGWLNITNYDYIDAVLFTDQNSATNGAQITFSSDGGTTAEKPIANTITGGLGAYGYSLPCLAYNAVKFDYTNGSVAQTAFHVKLVGSTGANTVPIAPLGASIDPTISAMLTRSILAAQNPTGKMSNLVTTAAGYLQNSIADIQVDLPIKALTTLAIAQTAVGTTAVQLSTSVVGRKTISIRSLLSNTANIYIGTSNAVTSSNGYELGAGESIDLELTEGQALWAISTAVSQRICTAEVS